MPKIDLNINPNIFCWKINESEEELMRLVSLDSYEKKIIQSHKREQRRKELLCSRILLQKKIPKSHIHYSDRRPFLTGSNKNISISNSKDLVIINLKEKDSKAGVDVQFFSDTVLRVKQKFLHQEETNIFDINDIEILNTIWSAKETLYKAYSKDKLEFKKNLICKEIRDNKIFGLILKETPKTFELGLYRTNEFVLTWFIN